MSALRIAVLGLGRMGSRAVARALELGHEVTVWNRGSRPRALGASAAASPAEAARGTRLVIAFFADEASMRAVLLDPALRLALGEDAS